MEDDYDIEDIFAIKSSNKKLNCGIKGKSGERAIVKILNEHFKDLLFKNPDFGLFRRNVGSGNRWSQTTLSANSQVFFSGDICCCDKFNFVIESKNGYPKVRLDKENKALNDFLNQAVTDGLRCNKKPLLVWKKNRQNHVVFIKDIDDKLFENAPKYKNWKIIELKELLKSLPDNFFFDI